jgi:chromosomal replication initiator protein
VGVVPKFTIKYIITMVAAHFDLEYIEIISERRTQRVVLPRQIAMWISYKNTTRSLPEIGRKFGDRDHTTILHAVRKIEKMIETNPNFAAHVREIVDKIQ